MTLEKYFTKFSAFIICLCITVIILVYIFKDYNVPLCKNCKIKQDKQTISEQINDVISDDESDWSDSE